MIIDGYVRFGDSYARFTIQKGSVARIESQFSKRDYRSYTHFAGVIGEFYVLS